MLLSITCAELFTAACACRACHNIIPAKSIAAATQVTTLAVNQILARSDRKVSPIAANLLATRRCAALCRTRPDRRRIRIAYRRNERISAARHRLNKIRSFARVAEHLPQFIHGRVDVRVVIQIRFARPQPRSQLLPRHQIARRFDQHHHRLIDLSRNFYRIAGPPQRLFLQVQFKIPEQNASRRSLPRRRLRRIARPAPNATNMAGAARASPLQFRTMSGIKSRVHCPPP